MSREKELNASNFDEVALKMVNIYINRWFDTRRKISNFEWTKLHSPWNLPTHDPTTAPQIWSDTVAMGCVIVRGLNYMQMICIYSGRSPNAEPAFIVGKMGSKCEHGMNADGYIGLCKTNAANRLINFFVITLIVNLINVKMVIF